MMILMMIMMMMPVIVFGFLDSDNEHYQNHALF